jgi:Protein of unknown function (DUF4242)
VSAANVASISGSGWLGAAARGLSAAETPYDGGYKVLENGVLVVHPDDDASRCVPTNERRAQVWQYSGLRSQPGQDTAKTVTVGARMPLYLDRHDLGEGVSAEDVASAHVRDLQVQDRYGVRYLTYWFDYNRQAAFCLVDAPNKAAAEACTETPTASSRPASLRSMPGRSMSF